jgi:hypothetical protein
MLHRRPRNASTSAAKNLLDDERHLARRGRCGKAYSEDVLIPSRCSGVWVGRPTGWRECEDLRTAPARPRSRADTRAVTKACPTSRDQVSAIERSTCCKGQRAQYHRNHRGDLLGEGADVVPRRGPRRRRRHAAQSRRDGHALQVARQRHPIDRPRVRMDGTGDTGHDHEEDCSQRVFAAGWPAATPTRAASSLRVEPATVDPMTSFRLTPRRDGRD